MADLGIPFKGSKNRIAEKLVAAMPSAECFVDLFAGGCSVAHAALLSGKYKRIILNDVDPVPLQTFMKALGGCYETEKRWISREDFFKLKGLDGYARYCFSYGLGGMSYAYGRPYEPFLRALHYAIVFDEWTELEELMPDVLDAAQSACEGLTGDARRLAISHAIEKRVIEDGLAHGCLMYERITDQYNSNLKHGRVGTGSKWIGDHLTCLNSLNRAGRNIPPFMQNAFELHTGDYRALDIPKNSVVYCDIPYRGSDLSTCYSNAKNFDYDAFYEWARSLTVPIFISEKYMPDDFINVLETKRAGGCYSKNTYDFDRLYIPDRRGAA